MLSVTEEAIDAVETTLNASDVEEDKALRLASSPTGEFGLAVDSEREGDQVVKKGDRTVLLIDSTVARGLDGAVLDVTELPEGRRLTLRMPGEA